MAQLSKEEASHFFAVFYGGEHHFPNKLKEWGYGWSMDHNGELASFDFSELTRLIVMAHDMCMRVGIQPKGGPNKTLTITVFKRDREGGMSSRHPELEEGVASARTNIERMKELYPMEVAQPLTRQ